MGLGFQDEECQMRYNVDKVATALQGAEDTSLQSLPLTVIKQNGKITQVQGKGQAKQVHGSCCVYLALELHDVFRYPHILQVLAVVFALSMWYKVMDHMWDPIEAAKWPRQLVVNYARFSQADVPGTVWRAKPQLHMMQ